MSTWDKIEEMVQARPVQISMNRAEAYLVREALSNWADGVIDETSAWTALEMMNEWGWPWDKEKKQSQIRPALTGPDTKAVKGLDPKEVDLIRRLNPNAKSRTGDTGEVMAFSPTEWLRIKKEIEAKPEYYDKLLGNAVSAPGLAKKIGDQIQSATGFSKPAAEPDPLDVAADGKPTERVPGVLRGRDQYSTDAEGKPAAPPKRAGGDKLDIDTGDKAARKRRVAAQDKEMMGGKTKPVGKVSVK